jgi:hypothetical protein
MRLFVREIVVDDAQVQISGPTGLLQGGVERGGLEPVAAGVPSFVQEWRPRGDSNTRPTV